MTRVLFSTQFEDTTCTLHNLFQKYLRLNVYEKGCTDCAAMFQLLFGLACSCEDFEYIFRKKKNNVDEDDASDCETRDDE